ncbi:N12 class adenine-specific DNA methylase/adenine-specific DNA methylase [Endobacter medicaginis]|uniref:Lactate dehydrogenase n=1 Tax=Endobacter medicaginis TaxID=1181271 RepID=A0A850NPW5_9PROT|nr:N12 class adenine-specific DNA methylase/adenine-specific DNA methylase [Endobacter medicaginis]NVN29402.1 lactate dehydrogenase [Endobacter medicaginis]
MNFFGQQFSLFDSTALGTAPTPSFIEPIDRPVPVVPRLPAPTPRNFVLDSARSLAPTWKGRAADNIAAIRLLKQIEEEERPASADEQATLARFVAFGATELATSLFPLGDDPCRTGWEAIGADLGAVVTVAERSGLMRATQYAHFTPEWIVRAMWSAMMDLGFRGGSVLEPGCGSSLFMATVPAKLAGRVAFTAVEDDPITARIAGCLFPEFWIRQEDFTRARLEAGYDLAIGNPPFSDRTVHADDAAGKLGLSLHDYFIARSIAQLRPGGFAAFVVSRWTMDKRSQSARQHIASLADLVGAVRLPQRAMLAEAGTEVVIDVLIFRKRGEGEGPGDLGWVETADVAGTDEGDGPLHINQHFLDHPGQVLGTHAWTTSPYGPTYTCQADGRDLAVALAGALANLPPSARFPEPETLRADRPRGLTRPSAIGDGGIREGSYVIEAGELHQIVDGRPSLVAIKKAGQKEGIFQKHARIIRALIPVRDHARQVLRLQLENQPYGREQGRLRAAYRAFTAAFGPINHTTITTRTDEETGVEHETRRHPNLSPFLDDPDVWLVAAIESYDEATDTGRPGPVFTDRVIHPPAEPVVTSATDALAVTLHECGRVDLPRICELLGRGREAVLAELGEGVFLDHDATTEDAEIWITADEFLSGPVRTKLASARRAAERDRRFVRNIAALEAVQPVDLRPSDVTARLGAPWIPASDVMRFCAEEIGIEASVHHTPSIACWTVAKNAFAGRAEATSVWGTERRHAGELLEDALTAAIPPIFDTWRDADGEHRELNARETEAAKDKLAKIKAAFEVWVWRDADRAERLLRVYNDTYNNLVPRNFDGSHLVLPGASNIITLRAHQKRVIWRIIAAGSTYIAHAVGSGKTFSMCAAVMEQKRLGLVTKPMIVVPGHCLAQISREFLMLYPTARILVADETNFVKAKRQRFLARAATAAWDAVIITHDAFKFIAAPAAFEAEMMQAEIDEFEAILETVDRDDRISRKRIERMKEGMVEKLAALKSRKDDLLHIGEIGIDQILVDEAQQFRKLSFATNQGNLKGIDPNGSQRAWDLYVKARYLETKRPGRGLVLASGTPITNTLGEMFSIQRFMRHEALAERNLHYFDAWAANFGDTRTELELQPSGQYKPVTRFSEFVNVADLMAMYRAFADVVQKDDLRQHVALPALQAGKRQIVVAPASDAFRAYQKTLAARITAIEGRSSKPQKGDDILLSVITDGRHAAIDLRLVGFGVNDATVPPADCETPI